MAISCIARVRCGSELDYVARMIGHVCDGGMIRTGVAHLMVMFGRVIA